MQEQGYFGRGSVRINRLTTRLCYAFLACVLAGISGHAQAQTTGEGVRGWDWQGVYYSTPEEACHAQWQWAGMDNGYSRFIGSRIYQTNWFTHRCQWTSYQYLCREETGTTGILPCWTVLPSIVTFRCENGYTRVAPGACVRATDLIPERPRCTYNNGGAANPVIGNPVAISTGAKLLSAADWESEDGLFKISRSYRSNPVGRSVNFQELPRGLAAGWTFDFAYEVQLGAFSGSPSSPNANLAVIAPDGTAYDFRLLPSGEWIPNTTPGAVYATTELQLEYLGTLPPNLADILQSPSQWRLTDDHGRTWTFVTFTRPNQTSYIIGRPTQRTTKEGYEWTFTYGDDGALDTLEDSFGRTATFTWHDFFVTPLVDVPGSMPFPEAVAEITLPDGAKLRYTYDPPPATIAPSTSKIERLVMVEGLDASDVVFNSTTYHYEDPRFIHHVTGVTDHRAVRVATYAYDARGRTITTAGAAGADTYSIEYTEVGSEWTRRITNPLGRASVYRFQRFGSGTPDIRLVEIDGEPSPNCPASFAEVTYGPDRFIATETDEEGRVTSYVRDAKGRPTTIVQADGTASERAIELTWHLTFDLPTEVAMPGLTTTFNYDANGRLLSVSQMDTTTHTVPYSTYGRTRAWTYGYTSEGLLSSVDGPLPGPGDTVSFTYSSEGYLATTTNEVGHTYSVTSHDGRGAPLIIKDENGIETVIIYDPAGRPLSMTVSPGPDESVFTMAYDAAGNVVRIEMPEGGWLEYAYDDSNRIISVENDRGETQAFVLNNLGMPVSRTVRSPSSTTTLQMAWAYDELGRAINMIGAGAQTWSFGYDKVSNVVAVTDPRNMTWTVGWDALNRVVSETDPETAQVEFAYAPSDTVTSFEDGRNLETTRIVDGFGLTIFESSPDRGERIYHYDAAGRLTQVEDADDDITTYLYDAAGRMLAETFDGASWENVTYTYDSIASGNFGVGRLTSVTDQSGSSAFTYDAQGRLITDNKVIQGQSYSVGYSYDANGEIASITYPSGRIVSYSRASDGRIEAVGMQPDASSPSVPLASGITYAPFGPTVDLTFGNGLQLSQTYDQNYWLTGMEVTGSSSSLVDLTFHREDDGALEGIVDGAGTGRGAWFGYTDAGRLQYGVGPWGNHSFTYDAAGNRTSVRYDNSSVITYDFAIMSSTSNRAVEVRDTDWILRRQFAYRQGGDLSVQDHAGGDEYEYYYGVRKRLLVVNRNGNDVASYSYDFAGRRVSRTLIGSPNTIIHYVFDPEGRLLAEHDGGTGAVLREYVWLEDTPLALTVGSGSSAIVAFIHAGQIGEPILATDMAQGVLWQAVIDPWGQVSMLSPPAGDLDLRLPGQWFQAESGFHQNWMRDYDPTLGRYIQVDPLGLAAGQNLYAYVDGDPLNLTDPTGEFAFVVPVLAGMAIGGGTDFALQMIMNGGRFECIDWGSVGLSALMGAVPGTAGSGALVRRAGTEFSHFLPARFFRPSSPSYQSWLPRSLDSRKWRALNGSYVTPRRHFRHDRHRHPTGWRDMGERLPRELQIADRIPDWMKVSIGGGAVGGAANALQAPTRECCR